MRRCAGAWRHSSRISDVGVVDLFALRLPAVFPAHVLPAVRTLQCRPLAGACAGAGDWLRHPGVDGAGRRGGGAARPACSWRPAGCGSPGLSCSTATPRSTGRRHGSPASSWSRRCFWCWRALPAAGSAVSVPAAPGRRVALFVFALLIQPLIGAADGTALDPGGGFRHGARSDGAGDSRLRFAAADCRDGAGCCWPFRCCGAPSRAPRSGRWGHPMPWSFRPPVFWR